MQNKLKQGEALFAEGKIEEAEKCFLEILNEAPKNKEAYNNLGVIYFQRQDFEQALEYLTKVLEIDPFYKDAIINYSVLLKSLNRFHESIPILEKAVDKFPDDNELSHLLNEVRLTQRSQTKIAVLCLPGLESFLGDIVDYLKTKYDVRTCYSNNNQEIESAVKWADIVWLEWANEMAVALTNHPTILNGKRVICRLHSYEAFAGYAAKIKWEKISDLIFVAEHIKDIALQQVPRLADRIKDIHIVPNGINLNKFPFKQRSRGKNLAYVGHINYKKGPMLLLHAFRELVQEDSKYRLFIAGDFQDARYELYFNQMIKEMNLANNIQMDGWVKDVATWLEDKHYIISTSLLESQQLSLCEAMARGIKPVVHNFVGARGIYPEKYLWNTIPEFVRMVTEGDYNSAEYRKYIEDNYSIVRQVREIERLFEPIGKSKESVTEDANVQENHQTIYESGDQKQITASKPVKKLDKMLSKHNDYVFDYSTYWNNRLRKDFSVTGVGHIDYSPELNKALYADRLYLLDSLIEIGILQCKSVLEIGPGTGLFTNYFFGHESVKDYLGVDIAKVSVDELTKKFGGRFKFQQGDFALKNILETLGEKRFDVVFAAAVLRHIVSDDGSRQFITNISRSLKDGGVYIGMEPISFLSKEETDNINMSPHNRIFRWEELNQCLKKNGLTVEFLIPISFIMNTPFDASRVNGIRADALNRLVVESAKKTIKNQEVINTIRFIDKNLIAEYQTGLSEWAVVCRKGKAAGEKTLPKSVNYKPLLEQLCTSVENRDKVTEVDNLLKCFETGGYDAGRLIDNFIPYQKRHVEKFVSSEPIEPLTIKTEEISNGTFHIDMLLRNSGGDQLFVQNIFYAPQRSFYVSSAFDPLKSYLSNIVSKMKVTTGSQTKIKSYVFDKKLKKDILKNELAYMWERAYPGTQYMHFSGLATIARRYAFAQRYIYGKDVLEAASGFGYGAASFSGQAKTVAALDIVGENIEFGGKTYGFDNISWHMGNVEKLPFESSSFDTYVSFETIEHLRHKTIPVYLSEASRVLRINGIFVVSTPNRKTREGRINNPYHLSEMYYEQLKEYLEKSFNKVCYYSKKGLAIYSGAYPLWADGFIGVCKKG